MCDLMVGQSKIHVLLKNYVLNCIPFLNLVYSTRIFFYCIYVNINCATELIVMVIGGFTLVDLISSQPQFYSVTKCSHGIKSP